MSYFFSNTSKGVRFTILLLCLAGSSACSLVLKYDECSKNADCSGDGLICAGGHCIKDDTPEPNDVNLLSDDCTRVYGVSDEDAKKPDTILLGSVLPFTGDLGGFGSEMGHAVELAVDEINQAGGILGKKLGVLFCDSATKADNVKRALQHIVGLERIPAVVGPASNSVVIEAFTEVAKDAELVLMSPFAASSQLSEHLKSDYLWRTVSSDAHEGTAIAHYLLERGFEKIAIVHRDDIYGNNIRDKITETLCETFPCDDSGRLYSGVYDDKAATTQQSQIAIEIEEFAPDITILLSYLEDGAAFLELVGGLEIPRFLLSNGLKSRKLFSMGLPEAMLCQLAGAQATPPHGKNYRSFELRFNAKYDDLGPFAANAYDAVYLLAYAIAATDATRPTGPNVAKGLKRLGTGDAVNAGSAEWSKTTQHLSSKSGATINYEGASGPLDFDDNGEVISDVEAWSLDIDAEKLVSLGAMYTVEDGVFTDVIERVPGQGKGCGTGLGEECANITECEDGDFCDLTLDPPRCKPPATGQGEPCASPSDCQEYGASYCETLVSRTCLVPDCDMALNNCSEGFMCCDFASFTTFGIPSLCVDKVLSEGICNTGTACTGNEDCAEGTYCDLTRTAPTCLMPPSGQGQPCVSNDDCAGFQADYCETAFARTCLMQGCDKEANNCSEGYKCCDFTGLGLPPLCVDAVASGGLCGCALDTDCRKGEVCALDTAFGFEVCQPAPETDTDTSTDTSEP